MHLDEVESVVRELIGYLVPFHGWSAGTAARSANEREAQKDNEEKGEKNNKQMEVKAKLKGHQDNTRL